MKKAYVVIIIIASIVLAVSVSILVINLIVVCGTSDDVYEADKISDSSVYDCVLVLGAGLRPDGTPSDMLKDRLDTAIELYNLNICKTLLLSGDCSGEDYDEVAAMKAYCLSVGLPESALICDNFGFSTRESMVNAKNLGYEKIIAVTQSYHLYRALFIAERVGLDAIGASADVRSYRGQTIRDIREIAARVKDFFAVVF